MVCVGCSWISSSPCRALSTNQSRKWSSVALAEVLLDPASGTSRPATGTPRGRAGTRPRSSSLRSGRSAPSRRRPPRTEDRAAAAAAGRRARRRRRGTGPRRGSRASAPGGGGRSGRRGSRGCRPRRRRPAAAGPCTSGSPGPSTAMSSISSTTRSRAPAGGAPEQTMRSAPWISTAGGRREPDGDGDGRRVVGCPRHAVSTPPRAWPGWRPTARPSRSASSVADRRHDLARCCTMSRSQRGRRRRGRGSPARSRSPRSRSGRPCSGRRRAPGRRACPSCGGRTTSGAGTPSGSPRRAPPSPRRRDPRTCRRCRRARRRRRSASNRWRRIRWACMRTVNMFGIAIGEPMT